MFTIGFIYLFAYLVCNINMPVFGGSKWEIRQYFDNGMNCFKQ